MNWVLVLLPLAALGFYCLYILWCGFHFWRIPKNAGGDKTDYPEISIVIAFRNETSVIPYCLRDLFQQEYPKDKMEVILVDDHSEDGGADRIRAEFPGEKFVLVALKDGTGKKAAILEGIKLAKGEIIFTTDADCRMNKNWLRTMAGYFDKRTGLVSGPVQLSGKGIFSKLQELEFMGLISVGAASMRAGYPNMCNGANLAYRKEAFDSVNGFEGSLDIPSGDDEFLMHKIASSPGWDVVFAMDRKAIVFTPSQETLRDFAWQRKRWVSKSRKYQRKSLTLTLALSWLGMLSFPLLAGLGFADPAFWWVLAIAFGAKILCEFSLLVQAAAFFNNFGLLWFLLPEQILHVVYVLWVGIAGNMGAYVWKGRKIK